MQLSHFAAPESRAQATVDFADQSVDFADRHYSDIKGLWTLSRGLCRAINYLDTNIFPNSSRSARSTSTITIVHSTVAATSGKMLSNG